MQVIVQNIDSWNDFIIRYKYDIAHCGDMAWVYRIFNDELIIFSEDTFLQNLITQSINDRIDIFKEEYTALIKKSREIDLINVQEDIVALIDEDQARVKIITNIDIEKEVIYGWVEPITTDFGSEIERMRVEHKRKILKLVEENKQLKHLAYRDKLTQLYNRTFMEEQIKIQCELVQRYDQDCSIIFFDIDDFKNINDRFGHYVGDRVLIEISQEVGNVIRASDVFARWGGEEFLILLPRTHIEAATKLADKLCKYIGSRKIAHLEFVTISLGVTQVLVTDTPTTVLKRVDKAMYKAKQNGKKQVVCFGCDEDIPFDAMKIHWQDSWNSGHQMIDHQHRNLIEISNQLLLKVTQKSKPSDVLVMFEEIYKKTKIHFDYEESVLTKIDYHDIESHRQIHIELASKLEKLKDEIMSKRGYQNSYLSFVIEDLVLCHMLEEDTKFFKSIILLE